MTRAHLLDTDDPVCEGFDLLANCGEVVPKAAFVFFWENQNYPEFLAVSMRNVCPKCAASALEGSYVYGIRAGQEALNEEQERFEAVA